MIDVTNNPPKELLQKIQHLDYFKIYNANSNEYTVIYYDKTGETKTREFNLDKLKRSPRFACKDNTPSKTHTDPQRATKQVSSTNNTHTPQKDEIDRLNRKINALERKILVLEEKLNDFEETKEFMKKFKTRKNLITNNQIQTAKTLINEGFSEREITQKVGISKGSVHRIKTDQLQCSCHSCGQKVPSDIMLHNLSQDGRILCESCSIGVKLMTRAEKERIRDLQK